MKTLNINNNQIGSNKKTYIIAEMSANHNKSYDKAVKILEAAKEAGADAIKLQTYTPDTMTIDCNNKHFRITGTIWRGKTLYQIYEEAYTPWEWQPKLKEIAGKIGIDLFSTPFDDSAVDFLEKMDVPAYKVASFENIDMPLLEKIAKTGKPVIISTGMASVAEIDEAIKTLKKNGNRQIALLKCTSAYPASPEEANLLTIPNMAETFDVPVGISDHTLGLSIPLAAVALGACIVEKHLTLSRNDPGPDSSFSLEPSELKEMVNEIRTVEKALGKISYEVSEKEKESIFFRRSLFVVQDMEKGELFTEENVRSIRPGNGLSPKYYQKVLGRCATKAIKRGTPLKFNLIKYRNQKSRFE